MEQAERYQDGLFTGFALRAHSEIDVDSAHKGDYSIKSVAVTLQQPPKLNRNP